MSSKLPISIKRWCSAISDRNPKKQSSLYTKDAVLLPTFKTFCVGHSEIYEYFVDFLDKDDLSCEVIEHLSHNYLDNIVSNGLYVFSFKDEKNEYKDLFARFTFVINNGYIITHHSSKIPKLK